MAEPQLAARGAAATEAPALLAEYRTDLTTGLAPSDASARRAQHGSNEFPMPPQPTLLRKYLEQFQDPMILLLLGSALISLLIRQYDDAVSIAAAVVIVSTVGFVQTYRSERSLEQLTRLMPPRCHCLRAGECVAMAARDLVPGDVVLLRAGDRIPADVRLMECQSLEIDESHFTGETHPVRKHSDVIPTGPSLPVMDLHNIAFMGTTVATGHAKGVVIGTAEQTAFGEVVRMMQEEASSPPPSPLQQSLGRLGKQLSAGSLALIALLVIAGLLQGRPFMAVFTLAVSLGVAAIPEGLPIVVTVTLALGVLRLTRRHVIVKRLPAIETLGCMTTICCDKTGTLTQNQQTVTHVWASNGEEADITGVGYEAPGALVPTTSSPTIQRVLEVGAVCNNATFTADGVLVGSPTEGALLVAARKVGQYPPARPPRRLHETPFDPATKFMAVQVHPADAPSEAAVFYVKGAPEVVLGLCSAYLLDIPPRPTPLTEEVRQQITRHAGVLAQQGLRVLAMAAGSEWAALHFLGLVGMQDPPRPGVQEAVSVLQGAGVKLKMITGDARETAITIARALGLGQVNGKGELDVMSGAQLEALDGQGRAEAVLRTSVFYRTTPGHKLLVVAALQAQGQVVGMTGDGVNDAVGLRRADVGIAMGKSGTDVAKEAADMVLVTDDFAAVVPAMEEGKAIFHNIGNFLRFQLSTSVAALSLIALSTLLRLPPPLNAMQVLWINILMDGPPAQSLGVEPVEADVMRSRPRRLSDPILTGALLARVLQSALVIVVGTLGVFWYELLDGQVTPRDTTMTFTCFVLFDLFNALACRSQTKTVWELGLFSNRAFLCAVGASLFGQLLVVYCPPLQRVFQTEALTLHDLGHLTALAASVWLVDDVRKVVGRRPPLPRLPSPGGRALKRATG